MDGDLEGSKKHSSERDVTFQSHLQNEVRPFIELIDSLRVLGIDKDLNLPSIAVVGDQSSGKSSVLEAISGVALPRGSGIVTRCPLELKLRKKQGQWEGKISYKDHSETFYDPSQVESLVRRAQDVLAGNGVGICHELISLEISSSEVCDLTLIDLPGITRVPVKGQPDDIGDQIRSLILKYITKDETINLVVVPCNVDIATTEALRMAQEVDPHGSRTLAILTKPDLIDRGAEGDVLKIVQGKVIPLSKGYIIVRCRGQQDINDKISLSEAMQIEKDFFRKHRCFSSLLDEDKATTECLARKLTVDLVAHIKKSLPHLTDQVQSILSQVQAELKKYQEGPPIDHNMMGPYLSQVINEFSDNIHELARSGDSQHKNLYALLRPVFKQWDGYLRSSQISFKEAVDRMIYKYDDLHRGRELLTFSDYSSLESLVKHQVKALEEPAMETLKIIREIIQDEFKNVCEKSFDNYPHLRYIVMTMIDDIQSKQEAQVETRIKEFIRMEQLVFTQDSILQQKLSNSKLSSQEDLNDEAFYDDDGIFSSSGCAALDSRKLIPEKTVLYYEIAYQRLSDYLPMLLQLFMLKDAAKMLRDQMMDLRNGADVMKLLSEGSEKGRKKAELFQRLQRLKEAQSRICSTF
ncbi:interferon-induced GTP-binding protein Mx3-like [Astyanax mexicanus]|uniref:Interferon-induced GTP-binding protein Mx3-like n=1 Tax=Astyanax mexicanus TaxID=7994 RepID=A0A8B9JX49_ASTMX|nr:interferon-induced GTP-binding protein Mx3-like [Astyanax mexicanus]